MPRFHPRPSPALVVSIVALVVALGGTSYATFSLPKSSVGSRQLKRGAVTTAKIKAGAITASKLNTTGVTVPEALHANSATSAAHAGTADTASHASKADDATTAGHAGTADSAASAQPIAFAHVNISGSMIGADSKNVGAVTVSKVSNALFCVRGIPFTVRGGQATVDNDVDNTASATAQFGVGDDSGFCPAGTQAYVVTEKPGTFGVPAAFFVELYG
jgi:hypothetical protein